MLDVARSYPFKSLHLRNVEEPFSLGVKFHAAVSVGLLDFIIDKRRLLFEVALHLHSGAIFGLTLPESDDLDALKQFQQNYKDAGFTALRHEKLFGYSDSKTGQDVYYHGFLLQI